MMDDFGRAYGLKSARLRYFNAAGGDPSGEIGEDHLPETHLISLVLDVGIGSEIEIFGTDYETPDGTAGALPPRKAPNWCLVRADWLCDLG
jgi:UDP-glucose 4-epimerase